ncbi:MAG: AAA family ATPase [Oligoflexia bacterium]|nr:AAA family ATPase [Oligoflexia bacterium]
MAKFIGRDQELLHLEHSYDSEDSHLGVIFGRRRIGKTCLLEKFVSKKRDSLFFEALEDVSNEQQLNHLQMSLLEQTKDLALSRFKLQTWDQFFLYLTDFLQKSPKTKKIIIFDELQWLAQGKAQLISKIKFYWDKQWKQHNVMLVLCRSLASFMVANVIRSKALYGRIDFQLNLHPLNPQESYKLLNSNRSLKEALLYQLIIGGIPKYYEWIDRKKSLEWNINQISFMRDGVLLKDFEKTFYKQFKKSTLYPKIVEVLFQGPKTLQEISKKLKVTSGGGLKSYLENLALARIIREEVSIGKNINSKQKRYQLVDEYLCFYKKFIDPYQSEISLNNSRDLYSKVVEHQWTSWTGLAFKRFCINNGEYFAQKLGIKDRLIKFGPYYSSKERVQIDLIFECDRNVFIICEMKLLNKEVDPSIIPIMEAKKAKLQEKFKDYSLETALIAPFGLSKSLRATKYFNYTLELKDILL